jgi:hypothetical protein
MPSLKLEEEWQAEKQTAEVVVVVVRAIAKQTIAFD